MKLKIFLSVFLILGLLPITLYADSDVIGTDNPDAVTVVILDSLEIIGPRLATVKSAVDVVDDSLNAQGNRQATMVVTLGTKASQASVTVANDSLTLQGNRQVTMQVTLGTKASQASVDVVDDSLNAQGNRQAADAIDIDAILLDTGTTIPATIVTLQDSVTAGDPSLTAYTVITNLNATVSSRASQASVDVIDDSLNIQGDRQIVMKTTLGTKASQASVDVIDDSLNLQGDRQVTMQVTLGTKASQASVDIIDDSLNAQGDRQVAMKSTIDTNLNATVSSRATATGLTTAQDSITALSPSLTASRVSSISTTVTTNLDAAVSTRATSTALTVAQDSLNLLNPSLLYSKIGSIKTVTDRLTGSDVRSTYAYIDAGGEQTVITIPISTRSILHTVWLDMNAMTQDGTIRMKYQVDGVNAQTFATLPFTAAGDNAAYSPPGIAVDDTVLVTYQESIDETASRDIPFQYIVETRE